MNRICLHVALFAMLSAGFAVPGTAAEADRKKHAVTDLSQVDADFSFQGEYVGAVWDPCWGCVSTGLQVIARGDGKFDAVIYQGGLPGAGWDGQTKRSLTGTLAEGLLVLRGTDPGDGGEASDAGARSAPAGHVDEIRCDGTLATVHDVAEAPVGELEKIQRVSPTMHQPPPCGSTVLFNGSSTDQLEGVQVSPDGLLEVGAITKSPVGDFRLHMEFRTPYMPYATGQARGNSGVYIQQRYEVQILDSFGLEGVENECGGLYRQQRPDVNMCLPPLSWQTYDIWFTAARFDDAGQKIANARITVLHNGVPIHCHRELPSKTGAGKPEGPEPFPILFQNHGNPVHFRNLWIVPDPAAQVVTVTCSSTVRCPRLHRLWRGPRRCR